MILPPDTQRLQFSAITMQDVASLQQIFSDPIAMQYYPSTRDEAQTREWISWVSQMYEERGFSLWLLRDKHSGDFVGQCGLIWQPDVAGKDLVEIGYLLPRQQWGKGYATEAAQACRDFGFGSLQLQEMISLIDPNNQPSVNVAKRNGFVLQQTIQRWDKAVQVYGMSAAQYAQMTSAK